MLVSSDLPWLVLYWALTTKCTPSLRLILHLPAEHLFSQPIPR